MASREDSALVAAARAGDRGAFAVLVARHHGSLLRVCRRAAGDPDLGADAAQEAVVHAMLGLDRLRRDDRFGTLAEEARVTLADEAEEVAEIAARARDAG